MVIRIKYIIPGLKKHNNLILPKSIHSHLGDPLTGERYLREALKEKLELYDGIAHPQVAFTLQSLGNVLNELEKQPEAM